MNEEHERANRPLSRGEQPDEFDELRQERQRPGSRDPIGAPPPTPPGPIGIAPPDPLNVVSAFETRPIGAYDFADTEQEQMGPGEVIQSQQFNFAVPPGYTAVLRRVRLEFTPPAAMNLGGVAANVMLASLLRDGGVIPNNTMRFFGELNEVEWPTHQVYGFGQTMGLQLTPSGWAIPSNPVDSVIVAVTFMGVLIPTKSRPPEVEIASDPVLVRDYDNYIKTAPEMGGAGAA